MEELLLLRDSVQLVDQPAHVEDQALARLIISEDVLV